MTPPGPQGLQAFEGLWTLSRQITDHRGGTTGQFSGTARFAWVGEAMAYLETGHLVLAGQPPMQAERRYLWRQDGSRIVVDFADGRPFHDFRPDSPEASHWCDPDSYAVRYDFRAWPIWSSTWRVTGPRKDYDMVSTYTRSHA